MLSDHCVNEFVHSYAAVLLQGRDLPCLSMLLCSLLSFCFRGTFFAVLCFESDGIESNGARIIGLEEFISALRNWGIFIAPCNEVLPFTRISSPLNNLEPETQCIVDTGILEVCHQQTSSKSPEARAASSAACSALYNASMISEAASPVLSLASRAIRESLSKMARQCRLRRD